MKFTSGNICNRYAISFAQKVIEMCLRCLPNMGTVLMFHDVVKKEDYGKSDKRYSLKIDNFQKLIETLTNDKERFESIENVLFGNCKKIVYVTFDDAYKGVYSLAYPILKRFMIPFGIFVTYNYLDQNEYVTKEMLQEMSCDPLCTIGSHTLSHPILRKKSYEDSKNEIFESKYILENLIGKKVEYFAYPYGSLYACSIRDILLTKQCGYKAAFSTINAHYYSLNKYNRYFIPRININDKIAIRMIGKNAK